MAKFVFHLRRRAHWYDSPACGSPAKVIQTRTLRWARKNRAKVCKACMRLAEGEKKGCLD